MKFQTIVLGVGLLLGACSMNLLTGKEKVGDTVVGTDASTTAGILTDGSRKAVLIGAGIGALAGGEAGSYMDRQEAALRNRLQNSGVSVTRIGNDIILNMPSDVMFDVDRSQIKSEYHEVLNSVAIVLNEYNQSLVDIVGHTDSDGPDRYNQELSETRAVSILHYLAAQLVDGRRLEARGAGETQPIAPNNTDAEKAQNRRVEIKIVPLTA